MLEGLPPNNAAYLMRVTTDASRARKIADLIVESFEPAEAASTAFETDAPWPGGGKAWLVEVYFGVAPHEQDIRELVAAAAGEDAAALVDFGLTEKRDWVANSLAGSAPCAPGAFSSMARMIAQKCGQATSASRSRRASPSAPAITAPPAAASSTSTAS